MESKRFGSIRVDYDDEANSGYVHFTPDIHYGLTQDGSDQDGGELTSVEAGEIVVLDLNSGGEIVGIEAIPVSGDFQTYPQVLREIVKASPLQANLKPSLLDGFNKRLVQLSEALQAQPS
ncbi:DUF2283 domain-containing protein [Candidatus Daviesbacteria bacterium]|nr:DUF2283 domain-containing protein [Candidatus Daviesbacteria bacterium]